MRAKIAQTLDSVGKFQARIGAVDFLYQIGNQVVHFFVGDKHHHSVDLTAEQEKHLENGGTLTIEYGCGKELRVKK